MPVFMMFGKYTPEGIKGISVERTDQVIDLIKAHDGAVKALYATLGVHDLVLTVELPSNETAIEVSLALYKLTGITFSTSPALEVRDFDRLAGAK